MTINKKLNAIVFASLFCCAISAHAAWLSEWLNADSVTSDIGWWSLRSFSIEKLEFTKTQDASMSSGAKGKLTISGFISSEDGVPEINAIHISQRFEMRDEEQICIYTVSPVVRTIPGLKTSAPFTRTLDIKLPMWQWGKNIVVFTSGKKTHEVIFSQYK